jgi:hypothetical protein
MVPILKISPSFDTLFPNQNCSVQSLYTSMLGGFWLFRVTFDFSFELTINNDFGPRGILRTNLFYFELLNMDNWSINHKLVKDSKTIIIQNPIIIGFLNIYFFLVFQ